MKKIPALLMFFYGLPVMAQTDRIDSLLNDLLFNDPEPLTATEEPVKYDFIYTGTNFSSNTFYAGREIGSNMRNTAGHIYYYNSTGLFAGVSGIWLDQLTPMYSSTTLTAGYGKSFGKKKLVTMRISYSRYIFYKPDISSYYPYKNNCNLGVTLRKQWFGARFSGSILFGEETRVNLYPAVYLRFILLKWGKYNKIYTTPEASAFFGTENVYTTAGSTELKEVYNLLNSQIYLPLAVSLGNFDIEFAYTLNFPVTRDVTVTYPTKSFYSVSIGYMVPIAKRMR